MKENFFFFSLQGEKGESEVGPTQVDGEDQSWSLEKKGLGAFEGGCKTGKHFAGDPVAIRTLSAKKQMFNQCLRS